MALFLEILNIRAARDGCGRTGSLSCLHYIYQEQHIQLPTLEYLGAMKREASWRMNQSVFEKGPRLTVCPEFQWVGE